MKLALSAVLALTVVALALFLWRDAPRSGPIEPAPLGQATVPAPVEPQEPRVQAAQAPAVSPLAEETQRSVVVPPEVAVEAAPLPATVRVRLVSRDDGTPVAGERLVLHDSSSDSWGANHIEGSRASPGQSPVTDSEGKAEFEVSAGVPLSLAILSRGSPEGSEIPALAEGEQREVTIELPTRADVTLHGRLVDSESGRPVAGGVVRVEASNWFGPSRAAQEIAVGADGTFVIEARSWEVQFVAASGQEHARVVFGLEAGHESPERALKVRLPRAATLEVLVLEGSSPVAGAKVELTTHLFQLRLNTDDWDFPMGEDPAWAKNSDLSGLAVVEDLPPRVPLVLAIDPPGRPRRVEADAVTLDPGERRRIEIHIGSGGTIVGRVEDAQGRAVPELEIWRMAAEFPAPKRIESYETPAARTRTDAQGRFRFDDVPPGAWHVGPPSVSSWDESALTANSVAAVAQRVEVEAGSAAPEILIQVKRGRYLSGTVLDPQGRPASEISVSVHSQQVWEYLHGRSGGDGRFSIGPLSGESYEVQAGGHGPHAPSESVTARAGDSGVTLQLRLGAAIRGRTLDTDGRSRRCQIMLVREGEDGWMRTMSEGAFDLEGLLPGAYALNALSSDGFCGRRTGLYLQAGTQLEGIDVVLERGARLRLTFEGEEPFAHYEILLGGVSFAFDGLARGKEGTATVPAGEIELHWMLGGELRKAERLTLSPGEQRSVTWDGKE